jgi:hypothetical protein
MGRMTLLPRVVLLTAHPANRVARVHHFAAMIFAMAVAVMGSSKTDFDPSAFTFAVQDEDAAQQIMARAARAITRYGFIGIVWFGFVSIEVVRQRPQG